MQTPSAVDLGDDVERVMHADGRAVAAPAREPDIEVNFLRTRENDTMTIELRTQPSGPTRL